MKIWSLPKHEHLTTGKKKYCGKEKLLLSSSFHNIFNISLTSSPITYIFVKCGCSNYFFFNSANLICRGTDISKYLIESIRIRDNESRLYLSTPPGKRFKLEQRLHYSVPAVRSKHPRCKTIKCAGGLFDNGGQDWHAFFV